MANPATPYVALKYPLDGEFGEAVPLTDADKIREYMRRYNMVVIDSVLSEKQCAKSVRAMWAEANALGNGRLDPDDPTSWDDENWPLPDHPYLFTNRAFSKRAWKNLVNKNVNQAFAILFGTDELVATTPLWSIKRPTYGKKTSPWYVKPLVLHLDKDNTSEEYSADPIRYQASIALTDSDSTTGGFAAVPGSANFVRANPTVWTAADQGKYILGGALTGHLHKAVQRIPVRAGNMIIWERGMCHANYSNLGYEPRITNFFTMVPARDWAFKLSKGDNMYDYVHDHPEYEALMERHQWDDRERKVLGLDRWDGKKKTRGRSRYGNVGLFYV